MARRKGATQAEPVSLPPAEAPTVNISPERWEALIAEARSGGAMDRTRSVINDLHRAIVELSLLRLDTLGLQDPTPGASDQLSLEQTVGLGLRLEALTDRTRELARLACPRVRGITDPTVLYADLTEYLDFPATGGELWSVVEAEMRTSHRLAARVFAVQAIIDKKYAAASEGRDRLMRDRLLALQGLGTTDAETFGHWLKETLGMLAELDAELDRRGIKPGAGVEIKPGEPSGSVEVLLLNSISDQPTRAADLCRKAGVKHNSHAKAALAGLVKLGRCKLKRGGRGGYFRP